MHAETEESAIFLSKRVADLLSEESIRKFKKQKLALVYRGQVNVGKPYAPVKVEFVPLNLLVNVEVTQNFIKAYIGCIS